MHVEPPEGRLASLKDFLKHYAMIVVSILTAIGLEQGLEAWHHHEEAERATVAITSELRANLAALDAAVARNGDRIPPLGAVAEKVRAALAAGRPAEEIRTGIIQPALPRLTIGFELPDLGREAWERAVAGRSAEYIESDRLGRFSAAYAAQRDIPPLAYASIGMIFDGPRLIDALSDARLDRVDPLEFLHAIEHYELAVNSLRSNLEDLRTKVVAAVNVAPAPGAHPSPAAPSSPVAPPSRTSPASR